jgi:hypothetical protein
LPIADCQLPIDKTKPNPTKATEGMNKSPIENRQLAIVRPTRYRVVVLTSLLLVLFFPPSLTTKVTKK